MILGSVGLSKSLVYIWIFPDVVVGNRPVDDLTEIAVSS